jgi:hypothetical protein
MSVSCECCVVRYRFLLWVDYLTKEVLLSAICLTKSDHEASIMRKP